MKGMGAPRRFYKARQVEEFIGRKVISGGDFWFDELREIYSAVKIAENLGDDEEAERLKEKRQDIWGYFTPMMKRAGLCLRHGVPLSLKRAESFINRASEVELGDS